MSWHSGQDVRFEIGVKTIWFDAERANRLLIAVKRPGEGVAFFKVLALPFGATDSVTVCLRISSAIAYVGTKGLEIPWSVFFDDFSMITLRWHQLSWKQTQLSMQKLCSIVGRH